MKLSLKWFWLLSVIVLLFVPLTANSQFIFDENPLLQKQAPNFTLNLTSGTRMSFDEYRGQEPALIIFWATWCPSCREELKQFTQQADNLKKQGIKVVLVNVEENPRLVKRYIKTIKLPFVVFLDEKSLVSEQYSVFGFPTLFFVDRNGVVVAMEHGLPDNFIAMLSGAVENK